MGLATVAGARAWAAARAARFPARRRAARSAPGGRAALLGAQAVDAALDVEQQSMRLTISNAIGEIAAAVLPRRALAAISASSKNCRRACAQQAPA